jgi:AcrR family transcriptional regulator
MVVDALLDLYAEGCLRPSAAKVASRAGCSPRSLFRYFADLDDLCRAAVQRQLERARPLFELDVVPSATLADRIESVVRQRLELFGAVAPAATVIRLRAPFQSTLAGELRRNRKVLRQQLDQVFAPELGAMTDSDAAATLAALDVLCSFESVQLLQEDQGLDLEGAAAAMTRAVAAVLAFR